MVVFGVGFEMTREVVNAGRKQGYLHLRRTSITLGALETRNDVELRHFGNGHDFSFKNDLGAGLAAETGKTLMTPTCAHACRAWRAGMLQ
jgi:hypothetical protein